MELKMLVVTATVALAATGLLSAFACGEEGSAAEGAQGGGYRVVPVDNPEYRPNELFLALEDITSPRFEEIRRRYRLAEVLGDEQDEMKRILLLRHWLHNYIVVDRSKPAVRGDALRILEEGHKGGRYSCGHFMVAQHAVMNAMGYVTRSLGAGAGEKGPADLTGHHGLCEIWSNTYCKWFVSDAQLDSHFEKDGIPLSALEIRDEVLRNGGVDVVRVKGPGREPQPRARDDSWGRSPRTYTWVSWLLQTNLHTWWLAPRSSVEVVYDDEYFRTHTWYWAGKPHWAYDAGYFLPVRHREWIEWTPNVLRVKTEIKGATARVRIQSCTPNFKEYQIREGDDAWRPVEPTFELALTKERHVWRLRAVNVMDVAGPEYRLVIARE